MSADFRFALKLSKVFSHEQKLCCQTAELKSSLRKIQTLDYKLGVLLVQTPASLKFTLRVARDFFDRLRGIYEIEIAIEPRNNTWASDEAIEILNSFRISKVLADPEPYRLKVADRRRLEFDLRYFRLHRAPRLYKNNHETEALRRIAISITQNQPASRMTWCLSGNTALGFATENALKLQEFVRSRKEANTGLSGFD